jgi:hypothetical protein
MKVKYSLHKIKVITIKITSYVFSKITGKNLPLTVRHYEFAKIVIN